MNPRSCCFTLMGGLGYGENHEYMHPCCVSALQAGGGGVGCVFMAHIGPLIKVEQHLNATGYLNIIANQVHPFMAAVYPSAKYIFSAGLCPMQQALSRNGSKNMTVNSANCSGLPSHQISIQLCICGRRWNELFGVEIHSQPT
ncbi:hypothetical protein J4Q44_G00051640 [Coregonus suidteri]|uniref:Uncharacterized protein n=1 Tax=Coregonus suidteri TaxID=861788 RepID=A0AAN8RFN7_9TELE